MFNTYTRVLLIFGVLAISMAYKITPYIREGIPDAANVTTAPFLKIGDGYYRIVPYEQRNWYSAYEQCRKWGSELVTFENVTEYDTVVTYLDQQYGRTARFWTSGNDLATTGTHNWFTNAEPITLNRWATNQPDNYLGIEHCILIAYVNYNSTNYQLNDSPCANSTALYGYICEADKPITASFIITNFS
ncbi:C-type lectin 37Da-like [Scaptodrosophila lebanonensis]|uniref:C-type lectin 37Da-like n=1 Tax=Drosophila lebanonensis TaxID=7225 RepID=A0A6J2TQ33_DROLE|nr:C-type lectin 37Da-like [Scaptodrosophila lebanonensis]